MTREELRDFFRDPKDGLAFCGCGEPEAAAAFVLRLLRIYPLYDSQEALRELLPDKGTRYFVLYAMDRAGVTDHGGIITGGWLTKKGERVRDALAEHEKDFEELFD